MSLRQGSVSQRFSTGSTVSRFCNAYGGENSGPDAVKNMGGLGRAPDQKGDTNWHCKNPWVGRFRFVCDHGHRGEITELCRAHWREFDSKDIHFCPRCNMDPPGHACSVTLIHVS